MTGDIHYAQYNVDVNSRNDKIDEILYESASLFSQHYGLWSALGYKPHQRVRITDKRLLQEHFTTGGKIAIARDSHTNELIGQACAVQSQTDSVGTITWVTQVVVHTDYRQRGIATTLLKSLWKDDHYAFGLCTSNPYTIRAMERATGRRCDSGEIQKNIKVLRTFANTHVKYTSGRTIKVDYDSATSKSVIDTQFFVDHSDIPEKLHSVLQKSSHWRLGKSLNEGEEWFAFTFKSQPPVTAKHVQENIYIQQ
jgi:GNAT superfamily N-acetyltransferase